MGVYQLRRELGQGQPGQQGRREELEKVSMQCPLIWGTLREIDTYQQRVRPELEEL